MISGKESLGQLLEIAAEMALILSGDTKTRSKLRNYSSNDFKELIEIINVGLDEWNNFSFETRKLLFFINGKKLINGKKATKAEIIEESYGLDGQLELLMDDNVNYGL